jgi:hypothetical protein
METVSVTTANTVCIRQRNTYIRIVNHSGNGKGMPIPVKNDTKRPVTMKKYTENHRKKILLDSCP